MFKLVCQNNLYPENSYFVFIFQVGVPSPGWSLCDEFTGTPQNVDGYPAMSSQEPIRMWKGSL